MWRVKTRNREEPDSSTEDGGGEYDGQGVGGVEGKDSTDGENIEVLINNIIYCILLNFAQVVERLHG